MKGKEILSCRQSAEMLIHLNGKTWTTVANLVDIYYLHTIIMIGGGIEWHRIRSILSHVLSGLL